MFSKSLMLSYLFCQKFSFISSTDFHTFSSNYIRMYFVYQNTFVMTSIKKFLFFLFRVGQCSVSIKIKPYSLELGALKLVTSQPCGFTPPKTCSIKLSFPAASIACKTTRRDYCHLHRVFLLQFIEFLFFFL